MKSIKSRLIKSFIIVIFSTVIILDILLVVFIKKYYYDNSEALLKNQIRLSTSFYNKYFSSYSLEETVYDNLDSFWDQTDAQVQIYNDKGKLIMDSIGAIDGNIKEYSDVTKVLNGEKSSRWVGKVDYYDYKVMAVSKPIIVEDEVIGVIRFIISLQGVDRAINAIVLFFLFISMLVLVIGFILSILIAKSIITPIKELTVVAEKMASGDLKVRSNIKDKDEIGKLANTLDYMAEEIQAKDELKNEFISSVSHELRTPLTSIKGWAITLDDELTDKETLKVGLNIIEKETDRLVTMVEELLDFSKLVNGKTVLNRKEVKVKDFIEYMQIYMSQRVKREGKVLEIKSNMWDDIVYIDIDKMKQVLINIVDNALKFTDTEGRIEIDINKRENYMSIIVEDNGSGISKEDLPRVKEKFYKGKNVKSQNGIGLSICDEIAKLHGGDLKIESEENIGTKITVIIPLIKGVQP
ncbi:ATP-binding protein [Clostridium paraputrificum]|uniref:sensor histidine kinase n=1 Tax=Clostridium paraputrificum TaxID=29363 RepID=UPI003D33C801